MAKCEKSFDGLSDLLIRDLFLNTCAVEMGLFLNERVPESVEEMVRMAEQYMEAHSGTITGKTTKSFRKQRTEHKTDPKADSKAQDWQEKKCFLCHRTGHIAMECKSV